MKMKLAAAVIFSCLTFLIPMIALTKDIPAAADITVSQPQSSSSSEESAEQTDESKENTETDETNTDEKSKEYKFRDYFMILDETSGKVEKVSVRDYVRGAVCSEMPPDFALEAMKAQAVAAHTYALRLANEQASNPSPELKGADFKADPSNWRVYTTQKLAQERYKENFEVYWSKICEAADSVLNDILIYDDTPIAAVYHSMSSGKTEDAKNVWQSSVPYLVPAESEGDTLAENFDSSVTLSADEVKKIISDYDSSLKFEGEPSGWFANTVYSDSGYITSIDICGKTVSGNDFRNMFSLRSSCAEITFKDSSFTFSVKGYGHGVGLSQYGADYMARQGSDYREILSHYYPNSEFAKVSVE